MSSEPSAPSLPPEPQDDESSKPLSKKAERAAKREATKKEKPSRRQESSLADATSSISLESEEDPLAVNYGDVPLSEIQSKTVADVSDWTKVGALDKSLENQQVLVRGRAQTIRAVGKKMAFLVIRENGFTVQCVVQVQPDVVSPQMVKYAASLSRESIVDVGGVVSLPGTPIKGATQQVYAILAGYYMHICDRIIEAAIVVA